MVKIKYMENDDKGQSLYCHEEGSLWRNSKIGKVAKIVW